MTSPPRRRGARAKLPDRVDPASLGSAVPAIEGKAYDAVLAGSPHRWGDYAVGEHIDHVDGMTLEEAERQMATRLYQNTAKVHFNHHTEAKGRFGKRIVYGGVVIWLARALSFNGLGNAFRIAAEINGGRHVARASLATRSGWSEVIEKAELPGRKDMGHCARGWWGSRNASCKSHPLKRDGGEYAEGVVLTWTCG